MPNDGGNLSTRGARPPTIRVSGASKTILGDSVIALEELDLTVEWVADVNLAQEAAAEAGGTLTIGACKE